MIYSIVKYGDAVLDKPSAPITKFDDALRKLADDMFESMYAAHCVGLAAPQIGIGRKIAERLIVEMRDRLVSNAESSPGGPQLQAPVGAEAEAYSALVALGYKPAEAVRLLKSAGSGGSTEDLIRRALQSAAR